MVLLSEFLLLFNLSFMKTFDFSYLVLKFGFGALKVYFGSTINLLILFDD